MERKDASIYIRCDNPTCPHDHRANPKDCMVKKLAESQAKCARLQNELEAVSSQQMSRANAKINTIRLQWQNERLQDKVDMVVSDSNRAEHTLKAFINDPSISDQEKRTLYKIAMKLEEETPPVQRRSLREGFSEVSEDTYESVRVAPSRNAMDVSYLGSQAGSRCQPEKLPSLIVKNVASSPSKNVADKTLADIWSRMQSPAEKVGSPRPGTSGSSGRVFTNSVYRLEVNSSEPTVAGKENRNRGHKGRDLSFIAPHAWFKVNAMTLSDACGFCGTVILFNKAAVKCADCKALCHPECFQKVTGRCVITQHLYE